MALTKQYRIEIQADQAQQQVADLNKKLTQLDKSLEGLDAPAAEAVRAEMAKVAGQIEAVESKVGSLGKKLDGLQPGSLGAIRQEVRDLTAQLDATTEGTAEYERILLKLGNAKGEIRNLRDDLKALNPEAKIQAFVALSGGVVGAFGVMSGAAQAFGLESKSADEFVKKTQGVIMVLQSLEAVRSAIDNENIRSIKNTLRLAAAWLGFGTSAAVAGAEAEAASTAAVEGVAAVEGALVSSGIGALLVGLGLLLAGGIALWHKLGEASVESSDKSLSAWTKFKANFMGGLAELWSLVKSTGAGLWAAVIGDVSGVIEMFRTAGSDSAKAWAEGHAAVIDAEYRKRLAHEAEQTNRLIEILRARGTDTLALEVANARRVMAAQEAGSKELLDAVKSYNVLRAQLQKRFDDDALAARLAHLNGLAALEQARGADAFPQQLAVKRQQLADLQQAERDGQHITQAQLIQAQNEVDALVVAHEKTLADKRRALRQARLNQELALTEAQGRLGLARLGTEAQDEIALSLRTNAQKFAIAQQAGRDLRAQAQVDWAAVVQNETAQFTLGIQRAQLYAQRKVLALQEAAQLDQRVREAILASAEQREKQAADQLAQVLTGRGQVLAGIARQNAADVALAAQQAAWRAAQSDMWGNILIKFFGVSAGKVAEVKQLLAQQFAEITNSLSSLASDLFSAATSQVQAALEAAQQQLQLVTDQLNEAQNRANDTAAKIQQASGARRDYLLVQLGKERQQVAALAAAKAKAATEEERQTKRKHELEKESATLAAASAVATSIATAAQAVYAGVKAVSKGSELPFPANLVAIVAGIAAVAAAVASARQLASVTRYAAGDLIAGPSHAQGGVPFTVAGRAGFEAEGGEFIVRKSVVEQPGMLPLLRLINQSARTYVKPHPVAGHFATGDLVTRTGGAAPPSGMVAISRADLSALLETNQAMLGHLQGIHGATQATEQHTEAIKGYGPLRLNIGPAEARDIDAQKRAADEAEGFATLG